MLDGLLGRGFAAKCKSLIKATKARIELIRKKSIAREKFLKKDIADLLASGLDINAYGRTEGLMKDLTLSSCYDFVEQCCDLLYKQLSAMQKQSECLAECKAAVASLMFAAARFSDLPELRDLRETFQEKYGNSLQYSVNQKFVEDLSSPPPTMENKIQLMQHIAAEYSLSWNYKAFEKQMAKPPAYAQPSKCGSVPVKDRLKADVDNSVIEKDKDHILSKVNYKLSSDRNGSRARNGEKSRKDDRTTSRPIDDPSLTVKESHLYKLQVPNITNGTIEPAKLSMSSHGQERNSIHREHELQDNQAVSAQRREIQWSPTLERQNHTPAEKIKVPGNNKDMTANVPNGGRLQDPHINIASSFAKIPPPYIKPPKASKAEKDSDLKNIGINGNAASKSPRDGASQLHSSHSDKEHETRYEKKNSRTSKGPRDGRDGIHINQDDSTSDAPLPKPKSVRRRHSSRLPSSHDDVIGNLVNSNIEKESSISRTRRDTKRGVHALSDNEHCVKDEEKVLDKLLIHYSTKPTNIDPEKLRSPQRIPSDIRPHKVEKQVKPNNVSLLTHQSRSASLPHEQSFTPQPIKVFGRAASFQPDRPAVHVHPNLPDCDDLAARIASIRSS